MSSVQGSDPFLGNLVVKQSIEIKPEDAGKPISLSIGGQTVALPTILTGPPIERPQSWTGERPVTDFPASVVGVLQRLEARSVSGDYAVSDPELLAAKKNFMRYVGLDAQLNPDGKNLGFKVVYDIVGNKTTAGVTPNGFIYGTLTTKAGRQLPFDLNIYTEPKFNAADLAKLKEFFARDAA